MAATIINRLKKTGQDITVLDRLGNNYAGKVNWFDEHFFSILDAEGNEHVFSNIGIAGFTIPGGHEKRALNRSDFAPGEVEELDEEGGL